MPKLIATPCLAAMLIVGCATQSTPEPSNVSTPSAKPSQTEPNALNAAMRFVTFKSRADYAKAYDLLCPEDKALYTKQKFANRSPLISAQDKRRTYKAKTTVPDETANPVEIAVSVTRPRIPQTTLTMGLSRNPQEVQKAVQQIETGTFPMVTEVEVVLVKRGKGIPWCVFRDLATYDRVVKAINTTISMSADDAKAALLKEKATLPAGRYYDKPRELIDSVIRARAKAK